MVNQSLLPTPTTQDNSGKCRDHGGDLLHEVTCGCDRSERRANAMLPTPTVGHIRNHDEDLDKFLEREEKGLNGEYRGRIGKSLGVAVRLELLPTVTTQDAKNDGGASQFERKTLPLNAEVMLMGTPRTSSKNAATPKQIEAGAPKARLEDQVLTTTWGKFEPAIRRWETILGRPAPAPTKPDGKDGNHRLSADFTEWLMGLPEGWITNTGITRNEALKAAGNGVVPQQAELALRVLLENTEIEGITK